MEIPDELFADMMYACKKVLGVLNHGTPNPHWPHIDRLRDVIQRGEEAVIKATGLCGACEEPWTEGHVCPWDTQ